MGACFINHKFKLLLQNVFSKKDRTILPPRLETNFWSQLKVGIIHDVIIQNRTNNKYLIQ